MSQHPWCPRRTDQSRTFAVALRFFFPDIFTFKISELPFILLVAIYSRFSCVSWMMSQRGIVSLHRPVISQHQQPSRGSSPSVMVNTNLYPLTRAEEAGSSYFHSYYLEWSDSTTVWYLKYRSVSAVVDESIGWILDESGDILYTTTAIEIIEQEDVAVTGGPMAATALIPTHRLWHLVAKRVAALEQDSCRLANEGVVEISAVGERHSVKLTLTPTVERPHCAVAVSACRTVHKSVIGKPFIEWLVPFGTDTDAMNHSILQQRHKCVKVTCSHYGEGKPDRAYNIVRITDPSVTGRSQSMIIDGVQMSVEEYFAALIPKFKDWSVTLRFPDAPLAVDHRGRFIPVELCSIASPVFHATGESNPLPSSTLLETFQHCPLFTALSQFGLTIEPRTSMQPKARVLPKVPARMVSVNRPVACTLISFLRADDDDDGRVEDQFVRALSSHGSERSGMAMQESGSVIRISETNWEAELKAGLASVTTKTDLFIVISKTRIPDDIYARLKVIFDLKLRVASQFVTTDRFRQLTAKSGEDADNQHQSGMYWESLLNQISLKLGPVGPSAGKPSGTVVVGVWTSSVPFAHSKLVSVTISTDNGMSVFGTQVRMAPKGEPFCFDEILYEMLIQYFVQNSVFPNRVIMYVKRCMFAKLFTGVSDILRGANAAVNRLNRELRTGINIRIAGSNAQEISPNWTVILTGKDAGVALSGKPNSPVVIDGSIVGREGMEFILQSSGAPVKYSVLHDTNSFTIGEIENFTHQMCVGGSAMANPTIHAQKALQRANSYIGSERGTVHGMRMEEVCDYLNERMFSADSSVFSGYRASYM